MVMRLPDGVRLTPLTAHQDSRGVLTELYRCSWNLPAFRQFNLVHSAPGVLRGVHVHPHHADYLVILSGRMLLGVQDIRRDSETFGVAGLVELTGETPQSIFIEAGVAHGFYLPEPTTYIYGLSEEWSRDGDFGCRWDDPKVHIDWPVDGAPELSERDTDAPSFDEMVAQYERLTGVPA